ncbi:protein of unknown function [Paenibacillus alvei]|uniref:Uncharacterized protein n=1 Tax=Paenibacillus alvei TaxID=44250 RepID=A0A383R712_PAEAL|nr:protein of unknown function [Paenibacillus alvei]
MRQIGLNQSGAALLLTYVREVALGHNELCLHSDDLNDYPCKLVTIDGYQ